MGPDQCEVGVAALAGNLLRHFPRNFGGPNPRKKTTFFFCARRKKCCGIFRSERCMSGGVKFTFRARSAFFSVFCCSGAPHWLTVVVDASLFTSERGMACVGFADTRARPRCFTLLVFHPAPNRNVSLVRDIMPTAFRFDTRIYIYMTSDASEQKQT